MKSQKELLEETQAVEEAIAEEVENLKENIWQKVKIGLTIAFVGVGTYWLLKKYLNHSVSYQDLLPNNGSIGENKEISKEKESNLSGTHHEISIVQMIKKEIAVFLLAIAKQKIQEILQELYFTENDKA